jgi:hypothetical protein
MEYYGIDDYTYPVQTEAEIRNYLDFGNFDDYESMEIGPTPAKASPFYGGWTKEVDDVPVEIVEGNNNPFSTGKAMKINARTTGRSYVRYIKSGLNDMAEGYDYSVGTRVIELDFMLEKGENEEGGEYVFLPTGGVVLINGKPTEGTPSDTFDLHLYNNNTFTGRLATLRKDEPHHIKLIYQYVAILDIIKRI